MFHSLYPFPDYIHIENFKAIGNAQRVPIRPLTLLFGQNSAGKSSILHAIALMAHFSQHGLQRDVEQVNLNGTKIRTGGYLTYRHRRKKPAAPVLGWQYKPSDWSKDRNITQRVTLSTIGFDSTLIASKCCISENGKQLISAEWSDKHINVKRNGKPIRPCYLAINSIDKVLTDALVDEYVNKLTISIENSKTLQQLVLAAIASASLKKEIHVAITDHFKRLPLSEYKFQLEDMLPRKTWHAADIEGQAIKQLHDASRAIDQKKRVHAIVFNLVFANVLPAVMAFMSDLPYADLRKVVYFGKHRAEIGLDDIFTKDERRTSTNLTNVQYSRGWTFDDGAVECLNKWLHDTGRPDLDYELKLVELSDFEGALEPESKYLLRLFDKRQQKLVSFDEVGSGIGQLLPVLLAANAEAGSTILVEQPELHLHPALQAEIADAFICSALGTYDDEPLLNRFILETHSEHMLLRLMRRIRQTTAGELPNGMPSVTPDDVAVLYIEKRPSDTGSIVRELRLNEMGQLIDDWPGGFFEEGLREVLM